MKKTLLVLCMILPAALSAQLNNDYPQAGPVRIAGYSPSLILQRNTNEGGFTQGIQTKFLDGTDNWFFGNLHQDNWIVSKGDHQNVKFSIQSNGNVGIGTISTAYKLEVNGSFKSGQGSFVNNANSAGADYNLELYSNNTGDPLKYVSLRFHQSDQFWGQIRYNSNGFRLTQGASDDLNSLTLGNLFAMNKVGIGTSNPGAKFEIRTNSETEIPFTVYGYRTVEPVASWKLASISQLGSYGIGVLDLYNSALVSGIHLSADGNSYINPQNYGSFGIGVTSFVNNEKLNVNGTVRVGTFQDWGGGDVISALQPGNTQTALCLWQAGVGKALLGFKANDPNLYLTNDYHEGGLGTAQKSLTITPDGNFGVGTQNPGNYKLNVSGKIRADEIIVNTSGADFVFDPEYNLPDLAVVEKYIEENKHLPGVPSAAIMKEEGMSMSEMQTKLLEKIEELTLYTIDQKKTLEKERLRNDNLENEIKELKELISIYLPK